MKKDTVTQPSLECRSVRRFPLRVSRPGVPFVSLIASLFVFRFKLTITACTVSTIISWTLEPRRTNHVYVANGVDDLGGLIGMFRGTVHNGNLFEPTKYVDHWLFGQRFLSTSYQLLPQRSPKPPVDAQAATQFKLLAVPSSDRLW